MAARFPGSTITYVREIDDSPPGTGTELVAEDLNQLQEDLEAVGAHYGSGETITAAGGDVKEISDAVTNAVTDGEELGHITSGTAAAGFGVAAITKLEDAGGTKRLVGRKSVKWAEAAAANYLPLTYEEAIDAGVVVGYGNGLVGINDLAGTPRVIVPGGTGDITTGVVVSGMVKPSSGVAQGGVSTVMNGETNEIYNDGNGNVVSLTINAGGDVVVSRDLGSLTYDIVLNLTCWI